MAEIDISSLKPNSFKYRNGDKEVKREKRKLEPVVKKGAAKQKKKPNNWFKKVVEFFADEEIEDGDVKGYIFDEWIIPGIKDILWDIAAMLLGDGKRRRSGGYRRYDKYYKSSLDRGRRSRSKYRHSSIDKYEIDARDIDYRNIIVDERRDAEKIVDALRQRIDECGEATVAELYDLCNIAGEYTDNDWGWTNPNDICLRKDRSGGYLIDVRDARYLKG